MAIQKEIFVSGRIGPVIFYKRGNTHCARAMPARVKQSRNTKTWSKLFGKASSLGAAFRAELDPVFPFPKNSSLRYRVSNALAKILRDDTSKTIVNNTFLEGFQFNEIPRWENVLEKVIVNWTGQAVLINIASLDIDKDLRTPLGARSVEFNLMLVGCNLKTNELVSKTVSSWEVAYEPGVIVQKQLELKYKSKAGSLYMVVLSISYFVEKKGMIQKEMTEKWLPCGIVGSRLSKYEI
jgi:hypothetical protein